MAKEREKKQKRAKRVREKIKAASRPRLSVFRSNRHISLQIVDDDKGKTLFSFSDAKIKTKEKMNKSEIAKKVGIEAAKEALKSGIKEVVFDRGGYRYHGRVKAVAEGAREGGLKF